MVPTIAGITTEISKVKNYFIVTFVFDSPCGQITGLAKVSSGTLKG